jgi:hypothetical protein
MYQKTTTYAEQIEFLASDKVVAFSITVDDTGITADSEGKKIVKAGSILDATGKIVNDGTAKGILFADVDVTNGKQAGSLIVEGYVLTDRLPVAPADTAKAAMTEIKFR